MLSTPSLLWNCLPVDWKPRLKDCVDQALTLTRRPMPVRVFFRADDIGVPGKRIFSMMDLFFEYRTPLCLALVPSWINRQRWDVFQKTDQKAPHLWCWHQHGWRHVSHETHGKKQEFGPFRSLDEIRLDIVRGREKLELLMEERFTPVFTPPWNRCDARTLSVLKDNGFHAVSRHRQSMPKTPKGLPDLPVNVDLHTRREITAEAGWQSLWKELSTGISSGTCGFMIHHQRMNAAASIFLETLLAILDQNACILPVHFKDMLHA
jgi:hypothetical protein